MIELIVSLLLNTWLNTWLNNVQACRDYIFSAWPIASHCARPPVRAATMLLGDQGAEVWKVHGAGCCGDEF